MKKLVLIISSCYLISCNNDSPDKNVVGAHDFFPVNSFLEGQVHLVDSLGLPVLKVTKDSSKPDTSLLSFEEFKSLAREFMEPGINEPSFKKFYKETSFADQSMPSITFTYSTLNKDLVVQRVDVIIAPDPVLNDKVQTVYMENITSSGDTSVVKKMYWRTNKNFQIVSSRQVPGQPAIFKQVKVIWDATE